MGTSSTQVEELVTNTEERVKTLETEIRESVDVSRAGACSLGVRVTQVTDQCWLRCALATLLAGRMDCARCSTSQTQPNS